MNDHRWELWRADLQAGRVRYRSAEYQCLDDECRRWHTVTAKSRNIRYDERNLSLEDLVLNELRTSGTHGCKYKKRRKVKAEKETPDDGPEDDKSGTMA
jgi:hypothetical protein